MGLKKNWIDLLYNVIVILCLLQCLYPWNWNLSNIRARGFRLDRGEKVGVGNSWPFAKKDRHDEKLLNLIDVLYDHNYFGSWLNRRHSIRTLIFTEPFMPAMPPQSNSAVRLLDGNDMASNVRRNELSLEDMDLIDCLWRQDIDAEKGLYSSIQPLENQFETDTQMLSEKSIPQQVNFFNRMMAPTASDGSLNDYYLKSYDENLVEAQKKFNGFDPYFWGTDGQLFDPADEKQLLVDWEKYSAAPVNATFPQQTSQPTPPANPQFDAVNQTLLNSSTTFDAPLNDVMLTSVAANSSSEYATFEPLLSIFDEPDSAMDGSMDWIVPQMPANQFSPTLGGVGFSMTPTMTNDVDTIDTPNLELSTNEITRLFSDRQVAQDLADAYEQKVGVDFSQSSAVPVHETSVFPQTSPRSFSTARSSVGSYYNVSNELNSEDYDYEILTEFLTLDNAAAIGPRDKTSLIQTYPDYDGPTTSRDSVPLDSSGNYASGYASSNDGDKYQSSIVHDHQYCSSNAGSGDEITEIEVSTSPSDYDDTKLMPRFVTTPFKKSTKDEKESGEYLLASNRDEELAVKFNLPVSAADVVNMPVNEFGVLLKNPSLTPAQSDLIRKIRRRGRNKVAAQNCRQRHMDDLQQLSSEVDRLEQERDALLRRQQAILSVKQSEEKRVKDLIQKHQRKS